MPELDGLQATRRILAADRAARVLILTTFDLDEYIYEGLRAGASGFVLKDDPPEQLIAAIRTVAAGDALLSPAVTKRVIKQFTRIPRPAPPKGHDELTAREREILRLIVNGLSNAEIGQALYISETTVKTHVTHILQKLNLRDRVQAVVLAYQTGLFETDALGSAAQTRARPPDCVVRRRPVSAAASVLRAAERLHRVRGPLGGVDPVDDEPVLVRLAVVHEEPSLVGLDELGAAPGMQPHDELAAVQHREALPGRLEQRCVVGAAGQLDVEAAAEAARERLEDRGGVLTVGHRDGSYAARGGLGDGSSRTRRPPRKVAAAMTSPAATRITSLRTYWPSSVGA